MNRIQRAMIEKDMKELLLSKQVWIPMLVVPLILAGVLPTMLLIGVKYDVQTINGMDLLMKQLPLESYLQGDKQKVIYVALNYMFPALFLTIPLMASSIVGASSIIGEKERKTLETILYTPLDIKELLWAKVLGTFIPAYIITILSFVLFGTVMNIGGFLYFDKMIFPNLKWLVLLLWLCPSISILGLTFIVMTSAKAQNFQESQQITGLVMIPILLLVVGQATGIFLLSTTLLFMLGSIVFTLDLLLFRRAAKSFSPEKLL